jgi:hypothetical protein
VRETIALGEATLQALERGETIERWLHIGRALAALQAEAMSRSHSNTPYGKRYTAAWAMLGNSDHHAARLCALDAGARSHALWMANEWTVIEPWLKTLTPNLRLALNHPRSVHRRYDAAHSVPDHDDDDDDEGGKGGKLSPIASYKARCVELETEVSQLQERLKRTDDGSLFNLASDTGEQIGRVIGNGVGQKKWADIKRSGDAAQKAKLARASHAG